MKNLLTIYLSLFMVAFVHANEYSTEETVRYTLNCMNEIGGLTDENLYTCICKYDSIRSSLTFSEYEEGYTYERNKNMAGEKGSSFRDNKRGEHFYEKLLEAREIAASSCLIVKRVGSN